MIRGRPPLTQQQMALLSTALANPMLRFPQAKGRGGAGQQQGQLTNPQDPGGFPSAWTGDRAPRTADEAQDKGVK